MASAVDMNTEGLTVYFRGEPCRLTGKIDVAYGGIFHIGIMTDPMRFGEVVYIESAIVNRQLLPKA